MIIMPAIDMVATGRNITKFRQDAGLSVKDLQNFFGFATPQAIYKWQHGTTMPTIDNLVALAVIFGVSMDDVIAVSHGDGSFDSLSHGDGSFDSLTNSHI